MTKAQQTERDAAIAQLREWIKPGDTVYTILEHVSRSGMQREIRIVIPYQTEDGRIDHLPPNYSVAKALGLRQGKRDGLIMGGCGMDMGFALVYELSHALYGSRRCQTCNAYVHEDTQQTCGNYVNGRNCTGPLIGGYACLGKGTCPSPYHSNARRNGEPERWDLVHTDGYALRHQWL